MNKVLAKTIHTMIAMSVWLIVISTVKQDLWATDYFKIWPMVAAGFTIAGIIFPGTFNMGVQDSKNANIIFKCVPIIIVIGLITVIQNVTPTYAIILIESYLSGSLICYSAYVITGVIIRIFKLDKKKRR